MLGYLFYYIYLNIIVYGKNNESSKYRWGIRSINIFERYIRRSNFVSYLQDIFNTGSLVYGNILGYLNLTHEKVKKPITEEVFSDSFDDLWDKSFEVALETFAYVKKYK